MFKKLYSKQLSLNKEKSHFLARSHHYWPDSSLEAVKQHFEHSIRNCEKKNIFFSQTIASQFKKILETHLELASDKSIYFFKNTNEFLRSITKKSNQTKKIKVLTTDSDQHIVKNFLSTNFDPNQFEMTLIQLKPFKNFYLRLAKILNENTFDIFYIGETSWLYGYKLSVEEISSQIRANHKQEQLQLVVDGSNSFLAQPFNLKTIPKNTFFITHFNNYGQSGEDLLLVYSLHLDSTHKDEFKSETLYRALYFFSSLQKDHLSASDIGLYIKEQQRLFLNEIQSLKNPLINMNSIVLHDIDNHGPFFVFELNDDVLCRELTKLLELNNLYVEAVGSCMVFSFGLYNPGPYDLSILNIVTDELLDL